MAEMMVVVVMIRMVGMMLMMRSGEWFELLWQGYFVNTAIDDDGHGGDDDDGDVDGGGDDDGDEDGGDEDGESDERV